ncbi:MAG: D-tyrosyl-tRNA(Tyr) deacylase, partial [Acidobacteria bacterium]
MRVVLQRVTRAVVRVEGETVGEIGPGLVVLVGIARDDTEEDARYLVEKTATLRVFDDDEGRMNRSVVDAGGA